MDTFWTLRCHYTELRQSFRVVVTESTNWLSVLGAGGMQWNCLCANSGVCRDGDLARTEGDSKTSEAEEAAAEALQVLLACTFSQT